MYGELIMESAHQKVVFAYSCFLLANVLNNIRLSGLVIHVNCVFLIPAGPFPQQLLPPTADD